MLPCSGPGFIAKAAPRAAFFCALWAPLVIAAPASDLSGSADVTGVLEVIHSDDFDNKDGQFGYFVRDERTQKRYRLRFKGEPPAHLKSGAKVRARGAAKDKDLVLGADATGTPTLQTLTLAPATMAGEQKVLVLGANFTDAPLACTRDSINNLMFTDPNGNSVNALYRDMSQNQVWLTGSAAGPFNLGVASTSTCSPDAWASTLESAARASGIDVSAYARRVYVFPRNSCGYAGMGTVGGSPSRSWIMRCDVPSVYAHEFGHNLGMHHAATPTSEYGDTSDIMGISTSVMYETNAPHQEQLGWVPSYLIKSVTGSGTFDIAPLGAAAGASPAPQVLKIAKPDTGEFYYLSYRQPLGFDRNLAAHYMNGVSVHRYKGDGSSTRTYLMQTLSDGTSFTDGVNKITVTQVAHGAGYATVQAQVGAVTSCTRTAPAVSVTPATQTLLAGTSAKYTFTVTNRDSASCAASAFSLSGTAPAGWNKTLSAASLALAPGATGSAVMTVASPVNATAGTYGLTIAAGDASLSGHGASGNASYVVNVPNVATPTNDTIAPSVPTPLAATSSRRRAYLSWGASSDNVQVTGYILYRDGVAIANVQVPSFLDTNVRVGVTYTYKVVARDAAGNVSGFSAPAAVTIKRY